MSREIDWEQVLRNLDRLTDGQLRVIRDHANMIIEKRALNEAMTETLKQ